MSAVAALAARLARAAPHGVRLLLITDYTAGSSPWIDELIGRHLTEGPARCVHLRRRPGPGYLYVGEGFARCMRCHVERAGAGTVGAGCGRCGARADSVLRKAVAVEVGAWTLFSAVCPICEVLLLNERDQAAAARSAGR
ncbi:hypothetical protein [Streptomyces sp. NBC_01530]|uniref:hypothetical protein n=1 Tax=Streptomyces sp. NBC_01530 TaxID=2903895 RepID=UPI00386C1311